MPNLINCSPEHANEVKQFRTELMHLILPRRPDTLRLTMFPHLTPQTFPLAFLNLDRASLARHHPASDTNSSSIHENLSSLRKFLATEVVPCVSLLTQHHSSAVLLSPNHDHITVYQAFVNADDHEHDATLCDDLAIYRSCTVPATFADVPAQARGSIPALVSALQLSPIVNTYVQARKGPNCAMNDELREPVRDFVVHNFLLPSLAATTPDDKAAPPNRVTITKKFPTDEFYHLNNSVWRRDSLWNVIRSIFHHQLVLNDQG